MRGGNGQTQLSRMALSVVLIASMLLQAGPARAQHKESPQNFAFELKFGAYSPRVDRKLGGTPYKDIFGGGGFFFAQIEFDWQFWHKVGSLAVGFSIGFGRDKGKALDKSTKEPASDSAEFNVLPLSIDLVYTFDYLARKFNIPLVPFGKIGLDYYLWWTRLSTGEIPIVDGKKGYGGTWGWHVKGGVKILLDFFAQGMADTFDAEIGVNNSYIFAEVLYARVDNFGRGKSLELSALAFMFGLAIEF